MLTDLVGDIKQQKFHQLWKFKLDTLIINHFIIKHILYDMVTRQSPLSYLTFHDVIFFHVILYYVNTLKVKYTEVKY